MRIYEKPMAVVEKIDVEDVITTSLNSYEGVDKADAASALAETAESGASTNRTIIFEW